MTKEKISLESTFTPWTLDCYQTFTFENTEDQEIYYYNEENQTSLDYDDFNWEYQCDDYLSALADNRLELLKQYIIDDVILDIKADGKPVSPKEYNFDTDKAFNDYIVNQKALNEYIKANQDDYNKNKLQSCDGFMLFGDDITTKLHYYLATKSIKALSSNYYFMEQYEQVEQYEYMLMELIKQP